MKVAYSPCPNDTFLFHAWSKGFVHSHFPIESHLLDVEHLNRAAKKKTYPLTKLSFYAYTKVQHDYAMLPVGAALGYGVGPLLISKAPFLLDTLPSKRMAIPGQETTAHFLCTHFLPRPKEKIFCTYDQIFSLLDSNQADCGVIIHEQRFQFHELRFHLIADLGALWEKKTRLPLPLGCIAIDRSLGPAMFDATTKALRASLAYAFANPSISQEFILEYAQVKNIDLAHRHIALYVTDETFSLSSRGKAAIHTLLALICNEP